MQRPPLCNRKKIDFEGGGSGKMKRWSLKSFFCQTHRNLEKGSNLGRNRFEVGRNRKLCYPVFQSEEEINACKMGFYMPMVVTIVVTTTPPLNLSFFCTCKRAFFAFIPFLFFFCSSHLSGVCARGRRFYVCTRTEGGAEKESWTPRTTNNGPLMFIGYFGALSDSDWGFTKWIKLAM